MGPEFYTVFPFAFISVGLSRAPVADSDMNPGSSYIKMFCDSV